MWVEFWQGFWTPSSQHPVRLLLRVSLIFLLNTQRFSWRTKPVGGCNFLYPSPISDPQRFHMHTLFQSVQFSHSVMSDSLWHHELQHARPPCPSPTPGVHPNTCPSSRWCHPAISSSVVPFSSCPQSLPASWSFPMSQLFAWDGQSTGVSALASVLPMNTQDWSPLGWTSLEWTQCSPRDSQESSPTPQFKSINSSALSFLHSPTLTSIHDHWKNHSLD